ncbi:MAG: hypothetical protein HC765_10215 [Brachymonas sp.]|nr:hypothetical protein [Brachymonas sp.]
MAASPRGIALRRFRHCKLEKLLKLFFSFERPEIANFRTAVEQFKSDLPAVLDALRQMIGKQEKSNAAFRAASAKFLLHAQEAINPSLTEADVREMLIQHILTEEIFAKVFDDSQFHSNNNVAKELYALEGEFLLAPSRSKRSKAWSLTTPPFAQRPRKSAAMARSKPFEGDLREFLQGLQHQNGRPPRRGLHTQ